MGSGPPPVRRANKLTRWEITPIKEEVERRRGGEEERWKEGETGEKRVLGDSETPLCWTDSPDRKQQMAPEVSQGSEGREKGAVLLYICTASVNGKKFQSVLRRQPDQVKIQNTKYNFFHKLCAWKR